MEAMQCCVRCLSIQTGVIGLGPLQKSDSIVVSKTLARTIFRCTFHAYPCPPGLTAVLPSPLSMQVPVALGGH
jgi:hypothetical protein